MPGYPPTWFAEDYDPDEIGMDDDEFDDFDCQMGPDGFCGAAGSEWCEWECPNNAR